MPIDAGTILAALDLDTSKFSSAMQTAQSQLTGFARDGGGISSMLKGMGDAMGTVGKTLSLGVSTPLMGAGIAATKMGKL